jgi:hypothetical protein
VIVDDELAWSAASTPSAPPCRRRLRHGRTPSISPAIAPGVPGPRCRGEPPLVRLIRPEIGRGATATSSTEAEKSAPPHGDRSLPDRTHRDASVMPVARSWPWPRDRFPTTIRRDQRPVAGTRPTPAVCRSDVDGSGTGACGRDRRNHDLTDGDLAQREVAGE